MNSVSLLRNSEFVESVVLDLKKKPKDVKTRMYIVDIDKKITIRIK